MTVKLVELADKGTIIDIICVTEHFIQTGYEDLMHIPNFYPAAFFSRSTKRGGACIFVRAGLQVKEILDISKQSVSGIFECCAVEVLAYKIIIICIYRIPKHNYEVFYEKLENILTKICISPKKKIVLCGDFNIDVLKRNKATLELEYFLMRFNLKLALYTPTRLSSNTCIDNFAHNYRKNCKAEVIDLVLSDHTSQILKVPIEKTCKLQYWKQKKQDLSMDNLIIFKTHLSCLSFKRVFDAKDANKAYESFLDDFSLLYKLCFPEKLITIKTNKETKWISRGIKICSKKQRQLLWAYRLNSDSTNKKVLKNYTKLYRKIIKLTQKAQNNHYINTAENKSKATWQIINKTKLCLPQEPILCIKRDNLTFTHPADIANQFNNYFIDEIENNVKTDITFNNINLNNQTLNSLFMQPVNIDDILKIITNLKNTNTIGYDGISTKVIKYTKEIIAPPLVHIINLCISDGIFPDKLKLAVIKPLHKKDDKTDIQNYRPLAKIPIFSKIIEKVIYNSLHAYFEKYNLFCKEQHGFRKNTSVNMALFDLLTNIMSSVDNRNPVCAIFTDMSKAFDYVDHNILLHKLHSYGIRGNILQLIKSYLSNRLQCVEISRICPKNKLETKYISEPRHIKYGVPQGSVLATPLFLIYNNDLPKVTANKMVLFADDSTAVIKCTNQNNYEQDINTCLQDIIDWLNNNNLVINLSKTKIMHFHQRSENPNVCIANKGNNIEETNETKFLGIVIDSKLTWKPHIAILCKKISKSAYALLQLSKKVNSQALLTAYHGMVASVLRYGIIFWGQSTDKDLVFKMQKRCIRSMCGLKTTDSCLPYFKSLRILTFPSLYILETALFVKNNPKLFEKLSAVRKNPTRTQYVDKLCQIKCKTALMRKSVFGFAPRIYNKVPNVIKNMTVLKFKRALNQILIEKSYYTVDEFLNDDSLTN